MSKLKTTPSGWKLTTLGTFMEFKNGVNADKNAYGSGTEFVNVMDIFKRNFMKKCNILGKVEITEKQKTEYSVKYGDILFNRTSEVPDEIAFSSVYLDEAEITFGGFVIRGRQKKELLDPLFAGYCFNNSSIRREMIRRSQGVVRANIGQKDLNKVPILIPPKDEQKKIASVLALWDNAIEKTVALIAAKEKQFEWLKSQLLLNNTKSKRWNTSTLGEFIVEKKEKSTTFDLYPCLTSSRRGIFLQEDYFSKQVASKNNSGYKIMSRGDFTFRSMSDDGLFVFNKQTIIDKGLISPAYGVFSPKQNMDSDFLYYFLNSPAFRRALSREVQGGTRTALKLNALKKLEVKIPCIQEQKDIASKLNIAKKEIDLVKELLEKYRSQKRGLMQKLLTGEWQVSSSQHLSEETYLEASA